MSLQCDFFSPTVSYPTGSRSGSSYCSSEPLALIVDDNDDNLTVMQYSLEMLGIKTIAVGNGDDAIEASLAHSFSIILLDVVMPDLDGFAVLKRLQQDSKYQQVPIVAVTAMAFSNQQNRMLAAGFAECLTKPYLLDELSSLVNKYLTQRSKDN